MNLKNQLEFLLFRGLVGLLGFGSPEAFGDLLGRTAVWTGRVPRFRRTVVLRQLAMVYPEVSPQQLGALADEVYDHLGRTVAEIFHPQGAAPMESVSVDPGWGPVEAALARGRGAIVATGHIGNFELGGMVLADRYPLLDVVKPQRNPLFDDFINDLRASRGILTVPMNGSGPPVLRHLRQGGLVSLLLDQDAGSDGLEVDFLGHPASTWPGAARLSIRTGCPVVPMAILRQKDRTHRLMISDPLYPEDLSTSDEDVRAYLQRISHCVESFIREEPAQWFWVHRRWKSGTAWRTHSKA